MTDEPHHQPTQDAPIPAWDIERPRWMVVLAIGVIVFLPLTIQMVTLITNPDGYGVGYLAWTMFAR